MRALEGVAQPPSERHLPLTQHRDSPHQPSTGSARASEQGESDPTITP